MSDQRKVKRIILSCFILIQSVCASCLTMLSKTDEFDLLSSNHIAKHAQLLLYHLSLLPLRIYDRWVYGINYQFKFFRKVRCARKMACHIWFQSMFTDDFRGANSDVIVDRPHLDSQKGGIVSFGLLHRTIWLYIYFLLYNTQYAIWNWHIFILIIGRTNSLVSNAEQMDRSSRYRSLASSNASRRLVSIL